MKERKWQKPTDKFKDVDKKWVWDGNYESWMLCQDPGSTF